MKWEEEKAFSFNEVGLQTSITWMPFQPKSLHEELTVTICPLANHKGKLYQSDTGVTLSVMSPPEHLS